MTDASNNIPQPEAPEKLSGLAKCRAADRKRKREQRSRQAAGITAGAVNRLREAWRKNLDAAKQDPELNAALTNRLSDFYSVRDECRGAITRLREGVHPEAPSPGRFYEFVGQSLLDLAKKYGIGPFLPVPVIVAEIESRTDPLQQAVVDKYASQQAFYYRMRYGLNIDAVDTAEYGEFFSAFFTWYLDNRNDPDYDYDWTDADLLVANFEIPEKYLTGIFADSRSIWSRLERHRKGLRDGMSVTSLADPEQLSRVRTRAEIQRDNNFALPPDFPL